MNIKCYNNLGTTAFIAYLSLISSLWCFLLVLLWSPPYSGIVPHLFPLHYEPAKLPEKHQVEIVHVVLTTSRLTTHQMLPRTDHLLHCLSTLGSQPQCWKNQEENYEHWYLSCLLYNYLMYNLSHKSNNSIWFIFML